MVDPNYVAFFGYQWRRCPPDPCLNGNRTDNWQFVTSHPDRFKPLFGDSYLGRGLYSFNNVRTTYPAGSYGYWRFDAPGTTSLIAAEWTHLAHDNQAGGCIDYGILTRGGAAWVVHGLECGPSFKGYRYTCWDCDPNDGYSHDPNVAAAMFGEGFYNAGNGVFATYLGESTIYLADGEDPTLSIIKRPPTGWTNSANHTIEASASDPGLGINWIRFEGPTGWNGATTSFNSCLEFGFCPKEHSASTTLGNLPDGAHPITVRTQDAAAHGGTHQANTTVLAKLDRLPPTITPSGTLWTARNGFVGPNQDYTLSIKVLDGSLSSQAAQRSGATSVTATLDGQPMTNSPLAASCTRPEGSCSLTLNTTLTGQQIAELDDAVLHTVQIKATDALGHPRTTSFSFRVDKVAPNVTLDGNLVDLEQRVITESSYRLRAEARDNTPDTFEVGDNGEEYPEFNVAGAGLRDLVTRLDDQTVPTSTQACFADPACEQARAWDWATTQAQNGTHVIEVTAADNVGNQGTESFTVDLQRRADDPTRTLTAARRTIDGGALGDRAGSSVASLGDVNGDQRADYLVGAPGATVAGRAAAGAAYIVLGSSTTSTLNLAAPGAAARRIDGPSAASYCGTAGAPTGDVNADGYDDFLIGCPGRDTEIGALTGTGRVFVVFGRPDPQNLDLANLGQAGFAINGPTDPPTLSVPTLSSRPAVFGERLASVPASRGLLDADVNGDGLADIILGDSAAAPNGLASAGATYVIYGKTSSAAVDVAALQGRGFVIRGAVANALSGYSAVVAGDLDGDTLADIVVGAPGATATDAGRAYVVKGATATGDINLGVSSSRVLTLTTGGSGDRLGVHVAGLADTDLDDRDDFAIATRSGAYVIRRLPATSRNISADDGFRIAGPSNDPGLGTRVPGTTIGSAGDLDGDERADIVVGYPDAPGPRAATIFSPEASRTLTVGSLPGQRGSLITTGAQQDRAGAAVTASSYQGQTPVTETGQAVIGVPNAAPDAPRLNAGRVFLVAERTPNGPGVDGSEEAAETARVRPLPGVYPISIAPATMWATLRSDYQQLVYGNLPNEEPFTVKRFRPPQSAFGYAAANVNNRRRCGWVGLGSLNLDAGQPVSSTRTCGYSVFRVRGFAALVNCDVCTDGSFVPFRSGTDAAGRTMPAQIPLYRNLIPFGPNERGRDREPERTLATTRPDPADPRRTIPNEVRFRYITRSGRWLLIKNRAFGNNQWGFVESRYFPPRFGSNGLCGGRTPIPTRSVTRRRGWPRVCSAGQYRVDP